MRFLRYVWALPNTGLGLAVGVVSLVTGGRVTRTGSVLEFTGGFAEWSLRRLPNPRILAMTLGYIIIARDAACLAAARDHEMVHVAQNGRWGPLFFPAYGISSLIEHMRGRDAYRDNLFEREAYAAASIEFPADGEPPAAC